MENNEVIERKVFEKLHFCNCKCGGKIIITQKGYHSGDMLAGQHKIVFEVEYCRTCEKQYYFEELFPDFGLNLTTNLK